MRRMRRISIAGSRRGFLVMTEPAPEVALAAICGELARLGRRFALVGRLLQSAYRAHNAASSSSMASKGATRTDASPANTFAMR
jgi:hypothetical protein